MTSASVRTTNLRNGDRLRREEFHCLYEQTPPDFRAELVGGIVYLASPVSHRPGVTRPRLSALLLAYVGHTPGCNATILLGEESEPQPDAYLRILPEYGGQSGRSDDDYIESAPELIVEIAYSGRSIDHHAKRHDYTRYGVLEYLVANLGDEKVHWFDLRADKELSPSADGVIRVRTFPGLWIEPRAFLAHDDQRLMEVLAEGLATPAHADFAMALAAPNNQSAEADLTPP